MNKVPGWHNLFFAILALLLTASAASAFTASRQDNRLLIDGKPTALTFARNFSDAGELTKYQQIGFNTLLLTLDSLGPQNLESAEKLITAAERRGLYILIEIANGAWADEQYADPNNDEYKQNCGYFLDTVISRFLTHPNLVGWVISTVDEGRIISDPGSLRDFLEWRYGTFAKLLKEWSETDEDGEMKNAPRIASWEHLQSLTQVQLLKFAKSKAVGARMLEDIQAYNDLIKTRDSNFQSYLKQQYNNDLGKLLMDWQSGGKTWGINSWDNISVDAIQLQEKKFPGNSPSSQLWLARYRASTTMQLMDWWAQQILKRDPSHLLFAGNQHTYRTLITLPRSFDGALTECYPGFAEADQASQNPQAIDIARRGNQFIVLAGVLAHNVQPAQLANAIYAAMVHGATGICVTDWQTINTSSDENNGSPYANAIYSVLLDFNQRNLLGRTPSPTVAIVYSPYIPGLNISRNGGLYGYMDYSTFSRGPGTPGSLFFQLREGTSFGQLDYLSADDLNNVPLQRYRTILLPSAFDIPTSAQEKLFYYVRDGGTVVADIGVGTLQATGDMLMLPSRLMMLFHVIVMPGLDNVRLNLEMYQSNERFPHVLPGMRTNGLMKGYMIDQMAKVTPMEGAQYLFTTVEDAKYKLPTVKPPRPMPIKPTLGMFYYQLGKGFAVYAPFSLYRNWLPENQLFGEFHYDLFGYNASVFLQRPIDFFPVLSEVAGYADGSVIAWTKDQARPEVLVQNSGRCVYKVPAGLGYCSLTADTTKLHYDVPGLQISEPLPISASISPLTLIFTTTEVSSQALEFIVNAPGAGEDQPVTLRISSGLYIVLPESTHQITINGYTANIVADETGVITLKLTTPKGTVRIEAPDSHKGGEENIIDVNPPPKEPIIDVTPIE